MQKRTFFKRLFVGLLLAIIVCMGVVIYRLQASLYAVQTALGDNQRISVLEQAVSDNYYESVDDSKLMDGALKGYISALDDPYSGYLTNEEYHSCGRRNSCRSGLSGGSQSCAWRGRYQRRTDDSAWKNRTEKNGSAAGNASHICLWNDAGK